MSWRRVLSQKLVHTLLQGSGCALSQHAACSLNGGSAGRAAALHGCLQRSRLQQRRDDARRAVIASAHRVQHLHTACMQ